ncbi:DHS-like NAD/FAD-binding domain-containing protein [Phialemonium atrogriseum]|uniref:DHS-like NAD/FAD-binding domain-containing protein n=1 Tax=Phialemonium atrogriseum TaxID=1093897 RepID=A0AAJ0FNQ4_9PEZI|nr:DHS-like NAD/FAD-binding domain-containing protein [Phialemonium atrogriseum]KAK1769513.1 DHS-like NAD/FAD-binding domain-containing protein [Phialemonium atrogriseum]
MDRAVKHEPSSLPSSPLSVLSNSPSLPSSPPIILDASRRYPSPISSTIPSGSASPMKQSDENEICVRTDGPPPAKRRKISPAKPRTTEYVDLESLGEEDEAQLDRLLSALRKKKKIVVIAGAGISVSAGIPDFRSSTGLFSTLRGQHKIKASGKHLFDASVYKHDSSTTSFHTMVRELAHMTSEAKPSVFHHMLASIAEEGRLMRLYSQNVDCIDTQIPPLATNVPLNLKGPWPTTIQLHGGLEKMVCSKCGHLEAFNGSLFEGPQPPPCTSCQEQDEVRTTFAGKRSHGIGRMRPRIVLYNEYNPDEEAIGNVSQADLRKVPDAVIVVGTSLKIPGVRRLVKELCQVTRSRRDGFTAWVNIDPEPQGAEFKDCWDLIVKGKCDDIAQLANLPRWDEQDIGVRETYMVTGDEKKERQCKAALSRDRIDILLEKKPRISESGPITIPGEPSELPAEGRSKVVEKIQGGILTPRASPKPRNQLPSKKPPKTKQSRLLFGGSGATSSNVTTPQKVTNARKPRQMRQIKKDTARPNNGLNQAFRATKYVSAPEIKQEAKEEIVADPYISELSSLGESVDDGNKSRLPSLRPKIKVRWPLANYFKWTKTPADNLDNANNPDNPDNPALYNSLEGRPVTPSNQHRRISAAETISPTSKPRSMALLID